VQALLRHSNIKTTLNLYAHAVDRKKLQAQAGFLKESAEGPGDPPPGAALGED
jgi:hypothetical protein